MENFNQHLLEALVSDNPLNHLLLRISRGIFVVYFFLILN